MVDLVLVTCERERCEPHFDEHPMLQAEWMRVCDRQPMPRIDVSRYQLDAPPHAAPIQPGWQTQTPGATARWRAEATSLHFDALQSWSGQMLVPAPHWQLALAHAGLLPDANLLCYPKDSPYTRITLQRLVPAPCAGIRLATRAELPQLLQLPKREEDQGRIQLLKRRLQRPKKQSG